MKIIAKNKSEQNLAALDPWTLVHFSTGLALGLMNIPLGRSVVASFAYEIAEQIFERNDLGRSLFETTRPESLPNATADILVFIGGHHLGTLWNRTGAREMR